ncbi:hypothetical protein PybrP1_004286 [[Pythium] brassicae (nom. inval.)]|nr:hypothetical protein PybrP1_004286 [[Pythium] brassicae (nom. inval.)]
MGTPRRLVVAVALSFVVVVLVAQANNRRVGVAAATAWSEDNDDDDDDDSNEFDFMSSDCSDQQCDAADAAGANVKSVLARGLVTKKPKVQDILQEHLRFATDTDRKAFSGETLGYVTPWNSRGYAFAKLFRRKFTYISPVWLQVREEPSDKRPIVTGAHDIDQQWLHDVRGGASADGAGPAIVPRVVYERNRLASGDVPVIISELLALSERHALDGFVFEIPVAEGTMDLLQRMGAAFRDANKLLLVVLNRSSKDGKLPITHAMFETLLPLVHRFSMNAYDFQAPGPNAPLPWLRKTLDALTSDEKQKLLLGIPFYGYDNRDAVTGPTYVETLANEAVTKIRWDATARFLHDRLQLYEEHGVGAAVWEIGQGLDYFFDLL